MVVVFMMYAHLYSVCRTSNFLVYAKQEKATDEHEKTAICPNKLQRSLRRFLKCNCSMFFCSKMNTCYLINEYLSEDFVLLHPTCKTNESSETSGPTETREAWDPSENSQTSKSSDTTKLLSFALNCCSDPERLLWHCDMLKSGLPGLKLRIIRQELLSALTITQQK